MPDEAWMSLSKEVEKVKGVMVLRGLPENSFQQLAMKMYDLRKRGVNATIQIDPRLFTKYDVERVPCFVTLEENTFDKLSGNISVSYALERMNNMTSSKLRMAL